MPDHHACYLTQALAGCHLGLREVQDGRWLVSYASVDVGYYDEREKAFSEMDVNLNKDSPISPL